MSSNWYPIELSVSNDSNNAVIQLDDDMKQLSDSIKKHYESVTESKSVMCYSEDRLFIWNAEDQCVYCCRLKDSTHIMSIQTVALTNPPKFDADNLQFSTTGHYLLISGSRGVNVLELPRKWGMDACYESGQRFVLSRSWCIAERFFVCNQRIKLLCCGWHPSCQNEQHIVLLTNDNCLRIFDITDEQTPLQVIHLSLSEPNQSLTESCVSIFALSLGESAVSYDFGPPISKYYDTDPSTITTQDECLWPIYILKGNGDVLLVYSSLKYPHVSNCILGPLTMMPPAEDNYGVDACNILCLDTVPPVIVIATSSGIVHHCIALDNADDPNYHSDRSLLPQPTLYVYESIELSLSLTSFIEDQDITCSVKLHRDPITSLRYFCSHSCGIHAIAIPFVLQIKSKDALNFKEEESIVEHLICTKPIINEESKKGTTPLGLVIGIQHGYSCLMVLLNSGEMISQKLAPTFVANLIDFDDIKTDMTKTLTVPTVDFVEHIKHILKRNISAPLLKSKNTQQSNECSQKSLQLLLTTTEILRKEYLQRFDLAALAIERRAKALKKDKQIQLEEVNRCSHDKENLIAAMEEFAIKYDNAMEKEEMLSNRIDSILESLQHKQPSLSEAEISLRDDLKRISNKLISHRNKLEQIRVKCKYQELHIAKNPIEAHQKSPMTQYTKDHCNESVLRSPSIVQIKGIREMLSQEGESITELLQMINALKNE